MHEPHHFTLGDEFRRVKLRHDGLEDFVSDGRQHPLIVIQPETLVDFGELVHVWAGQHAQRYGHHLHVLGPGGGGNILAAEINT